jgi:hypothetical protein
MAVFMEECLERFAANVNISLSSMSEIGNTALRIRVTDENLEMLAKGDSLRGIRGREVESSG